MIGFVSVLSLFITEFCEPSCNIVIEGLDSDSVNNFASAHLAEGNTQESVPAALTEYARSRVLVECSITKSCGAEVIQGPPLCSTTAPPTNPLCDGTKPLLYALPTFNASCKKCSDISNKDACTQNEYTCRWNKGKCQKTNCPHLFSDRFKDWQDSGMTMDGYIWLLHGKELEPYTKKACKSNGCIYSPSTYWCSGWTTWAMITTIVICALFVIAVVVIVVVICKFCRRNEKEKGVDVAVVEGQSTNIDKSESMNDENESMNDVAPV